MSDAIKIGDITVRPHIRDGEPSGKWQLDVPTSLTGGVRKRRLYGTREEAVAMARELWKRLRMQSIGFTAKSTRQRLSIEDAVREWERAEEDRVATLKKQAVSLYTDKCRLKAVVTFFKGRDIGQLDGSSLIAYQKNRLAAGIRPASINSEIRSLNKVFGWALSGKFIDAIPKVERIPEPDLDMDLVPTLEEVSRIAAALPTETAPLVWFVILTGCRPGEAYHLTWDRVDEVNGWAEMKPKDGWQPKNRNSIRRLPLDGMLLELIRAQPKDSRFVFPSTVDATKARTNMRKAFATAVKAAKIMRCGKQVLTITPKWLRKAFASWQAINGLHPSVLKALLGHAPGSNVTDKHYIHADEQTKRAAVVRMLPNKAV